MAWLTVHQPKAFTPTLGTAESSQAFHPACLSGAGSHCIGPLVFDSHSIRYADVGAVDRSKSPMDPQTMHGGTLRPLGPVVVATTLNGCKPFRAGMFF
jgi:hypothetical protein